jgi:hypothetical protein
MSGMRQPYAEGIEEPDFPVASPIASHTDLGILYNLEPSSRPLNCPVHSRTRFWTRFSQMRCIKSYGNDRGKEMDGRHDKIEVPLIP